MDRWQLCTLAWPFVLPLRPEDFAGLLISDISLDDRLLTFKTRFRGDDFNKGRMSFSVPWPEQFSPIVHACIKGREDGPLLLRRTVAEGRRKPAKTASDSDAIMGRYRAVLAKANPDEVQNEQDRKALFRKLVRQLGGLNDDHMRNEFGRILAEVEPNRRIRFYDTRGCVTTDMKNAGMDVIIRRYLTGHSLTGEILASYEHQDVHRHMAKYFQYIQPLLRVIEDQAGALKVIG